MGQYSTKGGLFLGRAFVRTYRPPGYADSWELVEDYFDTMAYASRYPDLGSSAISSRLDLPRGRIRSWLDGARPDCVRGLEILDEFGWLELDPE